LQNKLFCGIIGKNIRGDYMKKQSEKAENELKNKIIAAIENKPYSLVYFDYSYECFGCAIVVVKQNSNDLYIKVVCDRSDIYFYHYKRKCLKKIDTNFYRSDRKWERLGHRAVVNHNRYSLFLETISEQTTKYD